MQKQIPLSKLLPPKFKLRKVDRKSVEFLEMVESLAAHGQLQSCLVRPAKNRKGYYEIVDGEHRRTAAKDAGLKSLECNIREVSDDEALILTIAGNAVRVETKPLEYSKGLKKLIDQTPGLTIGKLAATLRKDRRWIGKILQLPELSSKCRRALNAGTLTLSNACELTRVMGHEYQDRLLPQAKTETTERFRKIVSTWIRQSKSKNQRKRRQQADKYERDILPSLRKPADVRAEMKTPTWGRLIIKDEGITDPVQAWIRCCEYMMNVDQYSYKKRKQKVTLKDLRKIADDKNRTELINRRKKRK